MSRTQWHTLRTDVCVCVIPALFHKELFPVRLCTLQIDDNVYNFFTKRRTLQLAASERAVQQRAANSAQTVTAGADLRISRGSEMYARHRQWGCSKLVQVLRAGETPGHDHLTGSSAGRKGTFLPLVSLHSVSQDTLKLHVVGSVPGEKISKTVNYSVRY